MPRCTLLCGLVACLVTQFISPTIASVASNWTNPRLPSYSSTYLVGERIYLSWQPLNNSWNDLWLVRDDVSDDFALRIATTLDVSQANSFPWTVAVSEEEVLKDTRFAFVFIPEGSNYDTNAQYNLESPSFNLMMVNQATPPNGTVGATTSSTVPTNPISSSSTIESSAIITSPTATSSPKVNSGLNHTQITGIAVGVLAAVGLAGFFGGYLMFKKRQTRHSQKALADSDVPMTGPYEVLGNSKGPSEMSSKEIRVYEMKSSDESFAHESDSTLVHEVGNTVKRPGLHEMPG